MTNSNSALDLSIIMLNWESLELTGRALSALREHARGIEYETIVVDNGSRQAGSKTELPRRFPWIRFMRNERNLGFTKACNQGVEKSEGRFILLLNNDTELMGNALGKSVGYMKAHPEVGALGILHRNDDASRSIQPSFASFPDPLRQALELLGIAAPKRNSSAPQPPSEQDVDWLCGSFLMIRRECWENVGPLDERFFAYDEDIDWCRRAANAGWKIRFWPGAEMIHVGSGAGLHLPDKMFMMFRNRATYYFKHHTPFEAAAYYSAMNVRLGLATAKALFLLILGRSNIGEVRKRLWREWMFLLLREGRLGAEHPE